MTPTLQFQLQFVDTYYCVLFVARMGLQLTFYSCWKVNVIFWGRYERTIQSLR